MNHRITALVLLITLAAFALTGCGGGDAPKETASPSTSATSALPSASKSPTETPTETPTITPTAAPEPTETSPAAEAAPAQEPAGADDVQQFFQTGGQCISDVWSSSMPYTQALQQKVIDYCAANQLGDWANGVDPMDPRNYGGGVQEPAAKSEAEEIAECQALDMNTASSGAIQYCYMEYGIDVHGAPAYDPGATPDVAGPSAP